jgi:hypothetical protein
MHLLFFLIAILCFAQAKVNEYKSLALFWNLFKHVHKKQHVNIDKEEFA